MRYRPFGITGKAVSAVSLLLREAPNMSSPAAWRAVVFAAMENGVNCFELVSGVDVMALGVGEALTAVERRLIFLSWRLRGNPTGVITGRDIADSVRSGLQKTRAGYLDQLTIDETAVEILTPDARAYLNDLRASGVCLQIGVAGDGPIVEACIGDPTFDVLTTSFSLVSDWQARRRIKDASSANMTLVACDPFPSELRAGAPRKESAVPQRRGMLPRKPNPLAGVGSYAFLQETPGWSFEELCLAYCLTEPAFATIQIEAWRADVIERVAAVTDKDLPTGVAAQIEMARFGQIASQRRA